MMLGCKGEGHLSDSGQKFPTYQNVACLIFLAIKTGLLCNFSLIQLKFQSFSYLVGGMENSKSEKIFWFQMQQRH